MKKWIGLFLAVISGWSGEMPSSDHPYGLSAADPCVALFGKELEMPAPNELGLVQTLNVGGGVMLTQLDSISIQFVEYTQTSHYPVLDIGCAYGVATLPALKHSTCAVIADDLCPEHLAILAKHASSEDRERLFLLAKKFPDEIDLPENSLGAVHICRVLHFLKGEEIEKGWEKIHRWLVPGGKLYIVTGTPYQKPIQEFIPLYEKQWEQGNPWPGYIENSAEFPKYANINTSMHMMDDRPLRKSLEAAGFVIEEAKFIDRRKMIPHVGLDGREVIGIVAKKVSSLHTKASIDLETMAQDLVLEAKQLKVPGYPTACNPSIIRWENGLVLSFNAYTEGNDAPDQMGLAYLDDAFNILGAPQILNVPRNLWQDCRLMTLKDRLYLVFNGAIDGGIRRMFIAQVHSDGVKFSIDVPEALLHFPGETADQWERNWIPFTYGDTLFLTSSLAPHRILHPLLGSQRCEEIASTSFSGAWDWGTPKPGTSAFLDGDHYLALFHSVKAMATLHSEEKEMQHYFMGAYSFENHPPFAITAISQSPIIGKNFYHGPEYKMTKPCRVVFPCGIIIDNHYVWVVFGRQDHEIWMAKLDKKRLYDGMIPSK